MRNGASHRQPLNEAWLGGSIYVAKVFTAWADTLDVKLKMEMDGQKVLMTGHKFQEMTKQLELQFFEEFTKREFIFGRLICSTVPLSFMPCLIGTYL